MKLSDVFRNYFDVRRELVEAVSDLTQEQLDWVPPGHTNSIGWLLAHIAEAEFWWIRVVAEQEIPYSKEAFAPFEQAKTLDEIFPLLEENHAAMKAWLDKATVEQWDEVSYDVPKRDRQVSMRWIAEHVIEHQARHRGQIFMMMHMQGLPVPRV